MAVEKIKDKIVYDKATPVSFIFDRINYIIMLAGIGLLVLGFFVMTLDTEPYGFGIIGLTIGPLIVALGFAVEFFAIFYKKKQ